MNPETKSEKVEFGDEATLSGAGLSRRQFLISDPSRCAGCQRCELACTEFNDGRANLPSQYACSVR